MRTAACFVTLLLGGCSGLFLRHYDIQIAARGAFETPGKTAYIVVLSDWPARDRETINLLGAYTYRFLAQKGIQAAPKDKADLDIVMSWEREKEKYEDTKEVTRTIKDPKTGEVVGKFTDEVPTTTTLHVLGINVEVYNKSISETGARSRGELIWNGSTSVTDESKPNLDTLAPYLLVALFENFGTDSAGARSVELREDDQRVVSLAQPTKPSR